MPAPSGSVLYQKLLANYGGPLGDGGKKYLKLLMDAVSQGWTAWQNSLSFGGLDVTGAGLGAWSGAGLGGKMSGSPYELPEFSFEADTPEQKKLTKALAAVLKKKFAIWSASYQFTATQYTGSCSATSESPGVFQVAITDVSLSSAGSGTNPSGIADDWAKLLTKPDFDIENPQAQTKILLNGVGKTIEQSFASIWLAQSNASANTATGPAASSSGSGKSTSVSDGKVL